MPASMQANVYSAVMRCLKTMVDMGVGRDESLWAMIMRVKQIPTEDPIFGKRCTRQDGRKIHDMFLFEVKRLEGSKYPRDYYRPLTDTPAE